MHTRTIRTVAGVKPKAKERDSGVGGVISSCWMRPPEAISRYRRPVPWPARDYFTPCIHRRSSGVRIR